MRLLLDTHVLLWVADDRLADAGRTAITEAEAAYVSAASVWEIDIKRASGRLEVPDGIADRAARAGFDRLEITFEHAAEAGQLPPHHHDPFDRMLIAQARLEGLTLMTAHPQMKRYSVAVLDVTAASGRLATPRPAP